MSYELKQGLLGWLDLKKKKRILVLGKESKEFVFSDVKYDFIQEITEIRGCYDTIILIDQLRDCDDRETLFVELKQHLLPEGEMIIGTANRLALRYLCGASDEDAAETNLPERQELSDDLQAAGFTDLFFYYPCYDHRFAQVIYSDACLPDRFEDDRIMVYEKQKDSLIRNPRELLESVIRNGTFIYYANYFLVIASLENKEGPRIEKVISSIDRDSRDATYLCFTSDRAIKKAASPEGNLSLQKQFDHLRELKQHGIATVDAEFYDNQIIMPKRNDDTLLEHIRKHSRDKDEILQVFQTLYEDLLQSSAILPESDEETGPCLDTGYIDMIPFNCFYHEGKLIYYDQEFTREACPLRYIMFRAIYYSYLHVKQLQETISDSELYEQYTISKPLYRKFLKQEQDFVRQLRKTEDFKEIYDSLIDKNTVIVNKRTDQKKAIHRIQLDLLKKLDRVCQEHGLRYYAIHGTLLGAVREHGFIPWDSDMDIAMPREDADRLIALSSELFPEPYYLQTMENDPGCFYGGYLKLRNEDTTAMDWMNRYHNCHQGIYLDIFPLDAVSGNERFRQKQQKRIRFLQRIIYAKKYHPSDGVMQEISAIRFGFYRFLGKMIHIGDLYRLLDHQFRRVKESRCCSILACYYDNRENRNIYDSAWFEGSARLPFEDMMIPVPEHYDKILSERYGDHYLDRKRDHKDQWNRVIYDTKINATEKRKQIDGEEI